MLFEKKNRYKDIEYICFMCPGKLLMNQKRILLIIILLGTFIVACSSGSSKDGSNSGTNIDTGTDPDSDFAISNEANRTSGVAPLSMHFTGDFMISNFPIQPGKNEMLVIRS